MYVTRAPMLREDSPFKPVFLWIAWTWCAQPRKKPAVV
jgi:hypothetical protein